MSTNIALVCPDGLSVLLFCKGIIRALQRVDDARVVVVTDAGKYKEKIEALGVVLADTTYPRWMNPVADLKYCFHLLHVFRREKCAAILNFSTKSNIYGAIAGRLAGVKTIISHVVGLGAAYAQKPGIRHRLGRRIFMLLYRLACSWSGKVWFTNANDLRTFVTMGLIDEKRAVLTRNYLDTGDYVVESVGTQALENAKVLCGVVPGVHVVVMVTRMIWQKGIGEFAEAAEILKASRPDILFVLIAPLETGSPDAVPESYIREKERKANLRWLGFQDDVKPFYALADLAVLPTYYKEGGYPRALLEPMSMGKPVIATTSEDCRGTIEEGKNGFLIPPRDASALAVAIERVMSDGTLRDSLGRYSRVKAVRDFDEEAIVPEALRILGFPVPA